MMTLKFFFGTLAVCLYCVFRLGIGNLALGHLQISIFVLCDIKFNICSITVLLYLDFRLVYLRLWISFDIWRLGVILDMSHVDRYILYI